MRPLRPFPLLLLLTACSATPPPADPAQATAPPSTGAPAASAAPGVAPSTPSSAAAPSAAASAAAAPPEDSGPPEPPPLSEAEQKEAEHSCKPLMSAVQNAKGSGKTPLEALEAALAKPPASMKAADLPRCRELLTRGIASYLSAAREVEAKLLLRRIGQAMALAYNENGKLCPSSEHPVPADKNLVAKEPYLSTEADWNTPAWQCLHFSFTGQPQRFQYEVRKEDDKTFTLIARGIPGGGRHWVELRMGGKVGARDVELGGVTRR